MAFTHETRVRVPVAEFFNKINLIFLVFKNFLFVIHTLNNIMFENFFVKLIFEVLFAFLLKLLLTKTNNLIILFLNHFISLSFKLFGDIFNQFGWLLFLIQNVIMYLPWLFDFLIDSFLFQLFLNLILFQQIGPFEPFSKLYSNKVSIKLKTLSTHNRLTIEDLGSILSMFDCLKLSISILIDSFLFLLNFVVTPLFHIDPDYSIFRE